MGRKKPNYRSLTQSNAEAIFYKRPQKQLEGGIEERIRIGSGCFPSCSSPRWRRLTSRLRNSPRWLSLFASTAQPASPRLRQGSSYRRISQQLERCIKEIEPENREEERRTSSSSRFQRSYPPISAVATHAPGRSHWRSHGCDSGIIDLSILDGGCGGAVAAAALGSPPSFPYSTQIQP
jgi:hypothetical protein